MSWLISKAMMDKYGNSLSSPEREAEYSEDISSDGEQCAPLKSMLTQRAYCAPDRMTEFSRLSRFGMMCEPLTEQNGEVVLTSYLADFPVRIFQSRVKAQVSKAHGPDSGKNSSESLARFDRDTCSWKIHQLSLFGGGRESLQTLPRWGMTRGGELYPLKTPALHTNGSEYGSWPTPQAIDSNGKGREPRLKKDCSRDPSKPGSWRADLKDAVLNWPTPRSTDGSHGGRITPRKGREGGNLIEAISKRMFPTATAHDYKDNASKGAMNRKSPELGAIVQMFPTPTTPRPHDNEKTVGKYIPSQNQKDLTYAVAKDGGQLNPTWVEWLMGWPLGWTDLNALEMDKSPLASDSRGKSCLENFHKWLDAHRRI